MSQVALAQAAGISPSYLNLIEHNRRAIAGKTLAAIARALDAPTSDLDDAADQALLDQLREAADWGAQAGLAPEDPGALLTQAPGWAALATRLLDALREQERRGEALSDRLAHDPQLAEALHAMLSQIAAVRSTADLLTSVPDIEPAPRARFLGNIAAGSARLSSTAETLIALIEPGPTAAAATATPADQVAAALEARGHHLPELEAGADPAALAEALLPGADAGDEARALMARTLDQAARDARALPLATLLTEGARRDWDPVALAAATGCQVLTAMRRLAALPPGTGPTLGLLVIDAAGHPLSRRVLPGLPLPRAGGACALWPVYAALSEPLRPRRTVLEMPGGARFAAVSIAEPAGPAAYDAPPRHLAGMLIRSDAAPGPALPVGPACRICPRDCAARTAPAIL